MHVPHHAPQLTSDINNQSPTLALALAERLSLYLWPYLNQLPMITTSAPMIVPATCAGQLGAIQRGRHEGNSNWFRLETELRSARSIGSSAGQHSGARVGMRLSGRASHLLRRFLLGGYCHTAALPGSRGFSTKHPDGCRGRTFLPDVFAQAHRPYRTDHTGIQGSASGSHWAAVVAYVLLIFGSSKTVVGCTSPYVPRVSACSRKYRLQFGSL